MKKKIVNINEKASQPARARKKERLNLMFAFIEEFERKMNAPWGEKQKQKRMKEEKKLNSLSQYYSLCSDFFFIVFFPCFFVLVVAYYYHISFMHFERKQQKHTHTIILHKVISHNSSLCVCVLARSVQYSRMIVMVGLPALFLFISLFHCLHWCNCTMFWFIVTDDDGTFEHTQFLLESYVFLLAFFLLSHCFIRIPWHFIVARCFVSV